MILADKIIEERKKNGWSQEDLAEMLSVSRQSVSKWEGAQSTPDLQRIIKMAEVFGVSTDYLLRDDMEPETTVEWAQPEEDGQYRNVSMEEANEFLSIKEANAVKTAFGVALCIFSPVILIILAGLQEEGVIGMSEGAAAGIGVAILLGLIAAAVYLFVTCSMREERFKYLEEDVFETAYGVSGMVKEKEKMYEGSYIRSIAIGVVLCIVAVIPLLILGAMDAPEYILILATGFLLCVIAAGVFAIVNAALIKESYETLLQEGEYSRKEKMMKKKTEPISTIYWCLVTAIYLGWSFWTFGWHYTWIIWPVAGVAYGIVSALTKILIREDRK